MDLEQVRNRYLKFFERQGHVIIPSTSLVPENDSTTLFTGAGMQPILPYLLGQTHPEGKRLVNSQKCFRTEDIEEVGDNRHTTFFEMLGNWSLGDYFKKDQLEWFFTFLTDDLGIPANRLYVTVFSGDSALHLPKDVTSVSIWKELFKRKDIQALDIEIGDVENGGRVGMQGGRIFYYNSRKNWWSRAGTPESMPAGEPGGPDSEVFFEFEQIPHDVHYGAHCHPNCDCGRFMEIGNSVFMEYIKQADGIFSKLPQQNVDFGGGLERITAALRNSPDVFGIDIFEKIISIIEKSSGHVYRQARDEKKKSFRIIADHVRAAVFLASDGVTPGNKDRGYLLRRLLRRAALNASKLGLSGTIWLEGLVNQYAQIYGDFYTTVDDRREEIIAVLSEEAKKFQETLTSGLKQFEKMTKQDNALSPEDIFNLYQSYGFPEELSIELAKEKGLSIDLRVLQEQRKKHRDKSRAATEKKFKGGLLDTSEMSVRYHTATHLLNQALRAVLGEHVYQKGSNITPERLRFDFPHSQKLSTEEIKQIEELVNQKIAEALPVTHVEMKLSDAHASGVIGVFGERYPNTVSVYKIGDADKGFFSQEICGGPHVKNTADLKGTFKIVKEEAVSKGVRRIKAVLLI